MPKSNRAPASKPRQRTTTKALSKEQKRGGGMSQMTADMAKASSTSKTKLLKAPTTRMLAMKKKEEYDKCSGYFFKRHDRIDVKSYKDRVYMWVLLGIAFDKVHMYEQWGYKAVDDKGCPRTERK